VPTHTRPATDDELDRSLAALRRRREQLDPRYPAHAAFGGMEHLILAVRDREVLADLDYDYEALNAIMTERDWITLQLIWSQTPTLFHARDPFPPGGVVEDPATGAAAAALGGYLRDLNLIEPDASVTVLQGVDHGTPSRLLVEPDPSSTRVRVTGSANRL
jgi:PhzF family phenazine biosynthesis protein